MKVHKELLSFFFFLKIFAMLLLLRRVGRLDR